MPIPVGGGLPTTQTDIHPSSNNSNMMRDESNSLVSDPSASDPRLANQPWLTRFPNTAFGIVLGIGGHAVLWQTLDAAPFIHDVVDVDAGNEFFFFAGCAIWLCAACLYGAKAWCFPGLIQAEWEHPVRAHFFNAIHIALLILCIGAPKRFTDLSAHRVVWFICAAIQAVLTQSIYARWLFDEFSNIGRARPPFLLSTVGWLLLTILGQKTNLHAATGLNLPAFCFGAGVILYFLVVVSIFLAMHVVRSEKGSPVLFLLLAPPALAVAALAGFNDGAFNDGASATFGWCLVVLLLLLRLSPQLFSKPVLLGTYWAYVFPLAALASAASLYAADEGSASSEVLALVLVVLAIVSLVVVFVRMTVHHIGVLCGNERWGDPVADNWWIHQQQQPQYPSHLDVESNNSNGQRHGSPRPPSRGSSEPVLEGAATTRSEQRPGSRPSALSQTNQRRPHA